MDEGHDGWALAARRLLHNLRQPVALEADAAGRALQDALGTATVYDAVRVVAERAVSHGDPRFATIFTRCDVEGVTTKVVAADLHISMRQLFRYRATIFALVGNEVRRVLATQVLVPRDESRAAALRYLASADFLLARLAPKDDLRAILVAERALQIDPTLAAAWCAIANANISLALRSVGDQQSRCARAAAALDRAEALAPRSGPVLALRAALLWVHHNDASAQALAETAASTATGAARAHQTLAWVYTTRGSFDEAEHHSAKAVALAPTVSTYQAFGMAIMNLRGEYERCAARCAELLEIDHPDTSYIVSYYAESLNAQAKYSETIAVVEGAPRSARDFSVQAAFTRAHALGGDRDLALSLARTFQGPAASAAAIALGFGDTDGALRALERARLEPNGMMDLLPHDIVFAPLMSERRFARLIAS